MTKTIPLSQAIDKAYLREDIDGDGFERFRRAVEAMFANLKPNEEEEEYNKNIVADMLRDSFYPTSEGYMINIRNKTDMAIYDQGRPVVLFEAKNPGRPDMVTEGNLNTKAMHQLVYYYLREAVEKGNTDIRYLIVTDCYQWFIFEKQLFYDLFESKKTFVRRVLSAKSMGEDTDYIYNKHIKPQVAKVLDKIEYTYFDLRRFEKKMHTMAKSNRDFAMVYRFLSPEHLLKKFSRVDHNRLNQGFYEELLYIMGVKEQKKKNSSLREIVRIGEGKRQPYSFIEQVYRKMEMRQVPRAEQFDIALNLVLTWVNRLLFLKLLESQLVAFNKGGFDKFLTHSRIKRFWNLSDLFFKILAVPEDARPASANKLFKGVPYLNSSLFEVSDVERRYVLVDDLSEGEIEVFHATKLKDAGDKRLTGCLPLLEYIFRFLDAYRFSASDKDEEAGEQKTIISAAVLGLIFEKINGYKDGAFFTPSYITEYMCRTAIRQLVVDRFNEVCGFGCDGYEALKEHVDYRDKAARQQANDIVNSIRVCDPAVGSGHFLVAALNELIAIKRDLRILQDCTDEHRRIEDYDIRVANDELVITDGRGKPYEYDPDKLENRILQQSLFEEKRTIIENCLFGVDLNPNSVEICRLRLWIELLKNAYYVSTDGDNRRLQTLPNIDINIKVGNTLSSAFAVSVGKALRADVGFRDSFRQYRQLVTEYKHSSSKEAKRAVNEKIAAIRELLIRKNRDLFGNDDGQSTWTPRNNFEWMMEFPEVMDDDGVFAGFDLMIGNPPYISLDRLKDDVRDYGKVKTLNDAGRTIPAYYTLQRSGDIYTLFVERGLSLLKERGYLTYILPNKWMKVMYGEPLRELFSNLDDSPDRFYLRANLTALVDFGDAQVFADATTYTCIIHARREPNQPSLQVSNIPIINKEALAGDIVACREVFDKRQLTKDIWITSSVAALKRLTDLRRNMPTLSTYIKGEAYYGIKTGLTEAFQIPLDAINEQEWDSRSKTLLVPYLQGEGLRAFSEASTSTWLLCTKKGLTLNGMGIDLTKETKPTEAVAWAWFAAAYPSAAAWLQPFRSAAMARQDQGDYWWELRACTYYERFEQPKIFYQAFQTKPCFVYDEDTTYCNNSIWLLATRSKALLALLNSRTGWWLISEFCPRIQNGYQLIWDNLSQIPVPSELPDKLESLADKLMEARRRNDEKEIDELLKEADRMLSPIYDATIVVDEPC